MRRESKALFSTAVVTGFGYASQVLSLFAIPLYLRTLGPENYGLMVTVAAFMGYLFFADAGLSQGTMILIAHAAGKQKKSEIALIVRHSIVLALGSGILVLLAMAGILAFATAGNRLPMFAAHPETDILLIIAGLQLFVTLQFGTIYCLFHGLQENYWTGLYQGLARILGLVGGMLLAATTKSLMWVMLWQGAVTALAGGVATVHAWRRYPWAFERGSWFDKAQYQLQLRVGMKNFMLQIGRTLSGTAPTLAIGSVSGPAMVPFYTVPLTLLGLFFVPVNSWNANLQGAYGEAWTAGDRVWVKEAFRNSILRSLVVAGLGLALFFALGDDFVRRWTHGRLSMELSMAGSVAATVLTGAMLAAGQYLLTGLNRHRRIALAEMVNGGLALALVVGLVTWIGAAGAGFGVLVAALLSSAWVLRRELVVQLGPDCFPKGAVVFKTVIGATSAYATARLVMVWMTTWTRFPTIALVLAALAGSGVYFALVLALKVLTVELVKNTSGYFRRMMAFFVR